jgi:hypothetical protein
VRRAVAIPLARLFIFSCSNTSLWRLLPTSCIAVRLRAAQLCTVGGLNLTLAVHVASPRPSATCCRSQVSRITSSHCAEGLPYSRHPSAYPFFHELLVAFAILKTGAIQSVLSAISRYRLVCDLRLKICPCLSPLVDNRYICKVPSQVGVLFSKAPESSIRLCATILSELAVRTASSGFGASSDIFRARGGISLHDAEWNCSCNRQ